MNKTFTAVLAALLPAIALAQNAPRADPLDATAATVPLVYRSAFTSYKKLAGESPPLTWRDANDAVERIGGWRAYAREANAPSASSPTPAASSPTPTLAPEPRATRPATPAPGHRH